MERARISRELVRPVGWLPEAHKWGRAITAVVLIAVGGAVAAWTLGWLAAVLVVALAVATAVAVIAVLAVTTLVGRVNALEEQLDTRERDAQEREERRPRLEIVRHQIIPRGFLTIVREANTGEEREGGESGSMLIVDVANRPVREAEGEEAQRVSAEISVLRSDGTMIVNGSRGHWVDASLGDYERTIPAGASALPMDVIAKLDDDVACAVFSERGFGEWHLRFEERAFMVDVIVKGHNTARLHERFWVEHDGARSQLRVVQRERMTA